MVEYEVLRCQFHYMVILEAVLLEWTAMLWGVYLNKSPAILKTQSSKEASLDWRYSTEVIYCGSNED